jgi:transposase
MDNASIHTSEEFEEYLPQWRKKGLIIKYLTPYSPELNLIEILWRNIKYTWLPFSAYQCLTALGDALENILKNFGSKYQITFA